jgi:hypothetical protein
VQPAIAKCNYRCPALGRPVNHLPPGDESLDRVASQSPMVDAGAWQLIPEQA